MTALYVVAVWILASVPASLMVGRTLKELDR